MSGALAEKPFVTDAFWSAIGVGLTLATGFCLQVIIGNFYSVAELGTYMFALSLFLTVGGVVSGGISGATLIEASKRSNAPGEAGAIMKGGLALSFATGLLGALLLVILGRVLVVPCRMPHLADISDSMALALPLFLANRVLLSGLMSQRRMGVLAAAYGVRLVLLAGPTLLAGLLRLSLAWAGGVFLVGEGCLLPLLLLLCWRPIRRPHAAAVSARAFLRPLGELALPMGASAALSNVDSRLDILVAAPLLARPTDVGLFTVALNVALLATILAQAIQRIFIPTVCVHASRRDGVNVDRLIALAGSLGALLTAVLCVLLAGVAEPVLRRVFPLRPELTQALPYVLLFLPAAVFDGAIVATGGVFAALDVPKWGVYVAGGKVAIRLILLILLIPWLRLDGAVLATGATWMAAAFATFVLLRWPLMRNVPLGRIFLQIVGGAGLCLLVNAIPSLAARLTSAVVGVVLLLSLFVLSGLARPAYWRSLMTNSTPRGVEGLF